MKNNIEISVIIPTHNRAEMIIACVESVLSQSYPVNEIIIVDDYSIDYTIRQLNVFKDDIVIIKNKKQRGAQTARNIGIKAAKSEWIAFLDSDDEWLPTKIEKQISALKIFNYDPWTVVHGNCYIKNVNSDKKILWQLNPIDGKNVYSQLLSESGPLFPSILTSKKALFKIGLLDEDSPSYHEWDTAIRLAEYCRFIHIQEPLFIYNRHSNTVSKNSSTTVAGYQYVINKFKNEIKELCGKDVFINHLLINSALAFNNSKNKLGREILRQIPNNFLKKFILRLLSYMRIKPIFFNRIKQFLLRE